MKVYTEHLNFQVQSSLGFEGRKTRDFATEENPKRILDKNEGNV